jgi:beta-glucosidase-like glycosyl hydrolase/CubicO group peptidase (beta-lactamase class C family)
VKDLDKNDIHLNFMKSVRSFAFLAIVFLSVNTIGAQQSDPPFLKYLNHPWVDSVMSSLNDEERVAQLIWVAAFSNRDISHEVYLSDLIRKTGIGGVIFFQDNARRQSEMINYFRNISKVPLMVVTDGEWGIGMRLENVIKFPYQMTLGAISNDSLIYLMGRSVANQFRRAGVQINLAPDADVDNNPQNPVINFRSFGEDPENVSRKTLMYMKGLQDNGIIAVAKHFPGHGDTNVDSHFDLPVIRHSRARLDSIELIPFKSLINEGISGVMPGHLWIPSLDSSRNLPSTISYPVITGLLKNELAFRGLVLSDAMNMEGITMYSKNGESEVMALKAGMDVLEYVTDPERAIRTIIEAIRMGDISKESISEKCRKVLAAKYWAGLNKPGYVEVDNILKDLSPGTDDALIRELYSNALTVLNNYNNILPVRNLDKTKIATVAVNRKELSLFQSRIADYLPVDQFFIDPSDSAECNSLLKKLSGYNLVIAGIFGLDQRPNTGFGVKPEMVKFLEKLITDNKTVITWFGNPYGIDKAEILKKADGLILAYQDNLFTEDLTAQLIFGAIDAKGKLPVTINKKWPYDFGLITQGKLRLQYGLPENAGISSEILNTKIDSIVTAGLTAKAYPGCVVMVARKGMVVFRKAYGFQTYDNRIPLKEDDLYDLASVTKISSTLAGLMLLNTEGKFSPDKTLGFYLPEFNKTNKGNIGMRDFLTHQAGLTPFIPFWKETIKKNGEFKSRTFSSLSQKRYPVKVAEGLYIYKNYRKKMFNEIKKSRLGEKKYVYSDLTFIIAPDIIERLTGQKWYEFVTDSIYRKIGAFEMGFNPYMKYNIDRIVPTEYDSLFRKQLLHGTVHDEGAAMLGGISGHAGLFSNANDLMKLMELYRRMGEYGGQQLIGSNILQEYTKVQFPENNNRRGLGFDKPLLNNSQLPQKEIYPARSASPSSFGHSGYTGTFVWVDPSSEISFVFLCNRVYPTRKNEVLYNMKVRSEILQAIYDSIIK